MSREEFISLFGEEAGIEMFNQQEAANASSGSREPFPLLKPVVDSDLGIGSFGEFVFGTTYAKDRDEDGEKVVEDAGTNLGKEFNFIICNVSYRFKRWVEGTATTKGKTEWSNIFTDMNGFKTAVDYNGNKIPGTKEGRQALGWKTIKIMAGFVEVNGTWAPVIFETGGKMYFYMNNLLDTAKNKGLLSGVVSLVTKTEKQGSTKYAVVDVAKSSFNPLPDGFFKNNAEAIADLTIKMKAYQSDNDYKLSAAPKTNTTSVDNGADTDDTEW